MITKESVVNSLLFKFQVNGYNLSGVYDGEETNNVSRYSSETARKCAVEVITSVDVSHVYFNKNNIRTRLMIVLSNEPEEILADYSIPPELEGEIDSIADAFYDQWEGKKWSKK
jgi:hypothetical protein